MRVLRILTWATIVVGFALPDRAEAQVMFGGSVRYGRSIGFAASPFGSAVSVPGGARR